MKIALCGSAGTGRSTIAIRLAQSINHTPLTNLAKEILKDQEFQYGTNITVEKFLATPERQKKLYNYKCLMESQHENFVIDRSWIDNAAYATIGFYEDNSFDISSYLDDCQCKVSEYDFIFHIPWGRQPLQPNGTRTINPWFQFVVDSVICKIADLWKIKLIQIPDDLNNNESIKWILNFLKKEKPDLKISKITKNQLENID